MWRYYFDDSFQRAKAFTKSQEISRILKFVNKVCLKTHLQNVESALSQKRRDYLNFLPVWVSALCSAFQLIIVRHLQMWHCHLIGQTDKKKWLGFLWNSSLIFDSAWKKTVESVCKEKFKIWYAFKASR